MLEQLKTMTSRSKVTLVQDLAGGASLVVILMVGLHLPSFF